MEIEFNGISADALREICSSHNVTVDIMPLAARDNVCAREEVREFGGGSGSYMANESCCRGYYYCGHTNCGRSTQAPSSHTGGRGRSRSVRRSSKGGSSGDCGGSNCNTSSDCDSSSDSAGAIVIFFVIVLLFFALIYFAPVLIPIIAAGFELVFALLFGLFNLFSFGVFRKKFKRVLVHFSDLPSNDTMHKIMVDSASFGGLPRRYVPKYTSNGFWLLRTGAYLFFPSLVFMLLVLYLQPNNGFLFRLPIVSFITAIVLIWFGNFLINRKTKEIATTRV
jgi:hypothetical protein